MNPFGIFDALAGVIDHIGTALGRKRRKDTRRERITFGVLYALLLLLGIAGVAPPGQKIQWPLLQLLQLERFQVKPNLAFSGAQLTYECLLVR